MIGRHPESLRYTHQLNIVLLALQKFPQLKTKNIQFTDKIIFKFPTFTVDQL